MHSCWIFGCLPDAAPTLDRDILSLVLAFVYPGPLDSFSTPDHWTIFLPPFLRLPWTLDHSIDKVVPGPLDSPRARELRLIHPVDLRSLRRCLLLIIARIDHVAFKSSPMAVFVKGRGAFLAGSRLLLRPAQGAPGLLVVRLPDAVFL